MRFPGPRYLQEKFAAPSAESTDAGFERLRRNPGDCEQYPAGSNGAIDRSMLMDLAGGDRELLGELASMFADESATMLNQLREAVRDGDNAMLETVSHALKGSAGTLTGYSAAKTAAELELLGRSLEAHTGELIFSRLESQVAELNDALTSFAFQETA